jgi:hypothetical protein
MTHKKIMNSFSINTKLKYEPLYMKLLASLLLLSIVTVTTAQDIPDYRRKIESFTKVTDKTIRRDLAAFTYAGVDESMTKQPLKAMPALGLVDTTMRFADGNAKVQIITGKFEQKNKKMYYFDKIHLLKIDGKPFFGDYGKLPKTTISGIHFITGKDTLKLPEVAFKDIYNPKFIFKDGNNVQRTLSGVYYSPDKITMYIHMVCRDASDKFEVTWIIRDKKYLRRVVDYNLP